MLVTAGLMVLAKTLMNLGGFIKRPEFLSSTLAHPNYFVSF